MKSAVVLLSGGLDSMVCAALAREGGFSVLALTVDYNQRHRVELEAARKIAAMLAEKHIVLPMDLTAFGGSALTSDLLSRLERGEINVNDVLNRLKKAEDDHE